MNNSKTILIIGKNGQLGRGLYRELNQMNEVNLLCLGKDSLDITDGKQVKEAFKQYLPKIIINAAAYTQVDKAEKDKAKAFSVNSDSLSIIGSEAEDIGAMVIHYSTDYVFDGTKNESYLESDSTNPINTYGESKFLGELNLKRASSKYIILRTSWVYSDWGNNFVNTIISKALSGRDLNIVSDQIGSPTSVFEIAENTSRIIRSYFKKEDQTNFGTYHMTCVDYTSWYGLAKEIINYKYQSRSLSGISLARLRRINSSDYISPAKRPMNSRLNNSLLNSIFGLELQEWKAALFKVLNRIDLGSLHA